MRTETAPPTGRRKITPAMIAARAARPTTWQPVKRGEALSALKRAAPALGIPRQVVTLMDYLVGRTRDVDWAEGGRPMAWPSNVTLQDVLDVGRTQVKTLIRVALEHGLLEMDESPNGQRYGYREEGQIAEAYGFDLTPLAARACRAGADCPGTPGTPPRRCPNARPDHERPQQGADDRRGRQLARAGGRGPCPCRAAGRHPRPWPTRAGALAPGSLVGYGRRAAYGLCITCGN